MDTVTALLVALGIGAGLQALRRSRLDDVWSFIGLCKRHHRRSVQSGDGVLGGADPDATARMAVEHFGGSLDGATVADLFPLLCSRYWREAVAVMQGCLIRRHRLPRTYRARWGQRELVKAFWLPRPNRLRHYTAPATALEYLQSASAYGKLLVEAEDGVVEGVPVDWFRQFMEQHFDGARQVSLLELRAHLSPADDIPEAAETARNVRRCITGRIKREGEFHPDYDDDLPGLEPPQFAAVLSIHRQQDPVTRQEVGRSGPH